MITQLKELFKLSSLFQKVVIPLLAYLFLGITQNAFNWPKPSNQALKNALDLGAYVVILILLYVMLSPILWLRPTLKVKVYKTKSSQVRPETSEVLYLSVRDRQADVTVALEFAPSWRTRLWKNRIIKKSGLAGLKRLGIRFSWQPPGLLSCTSARAGDTDYWNSTQDELALYPFGRMNFDDTDVFIEYSFRFALGATPGVQQARLRPKHLNGRSRILFGLSCNEEFLLDIKETA
jgi:hypothetical protein